MRNSMPWASLFLFAAIAAGLSDRAVAAAEPVPPHETFTVESAPAPAQDARDRFFATLKGLCGARFEGAMTFPADGQHEFAGKRLVAHVASCSDDEVRVPFQVGEDRSRTWVFSRTADGLQLKHDHRHADGTPDAVTLYGGLASATGTPLKQSFPADAYTAKLIPAAVTNVWTVSLSADGTSLTYHLERDAKPRFTAVLERKPAQEAQKE
jgi:hypothetical protein